MQTSGNEAAGRHEEDATGYDEDDDPVAARPAQRHGEPARPSAARLHDGAHAGAAGDVRAGAAGGGRGKQLAGECSVVFTYFREEHIIKESQR